MIQFSEAQLQEVERIKSRYPEGKHKSALIPVLHMFMIYVIAQYSD
jgi:NADH-quinone oxidoreductase subunit E